jgi:hypothetical protein
MLLISQIFLLDQSCLLGGGGLGLDPCPVLTVEPVMLSLSIQVGTSFDHSLCPLPLVCRLLSLQVRQLSILFLY